MLKADNRSCLILSRIYYVPGFGVNLLSGIKLYKGGLEGSFNKNTLKIKTPSGRTIIKATKLGGVYIVNWVHKTINQEFALNAYNQMYQSGSNNAAMDAESSDNTDLPGVISGSLNNLSTTPIVSTGPLTSFAQKNYDLWHRRFAYFNPNIIRRFYKVTTLADKITAPVSDKLCEICAVTKIRNRTSKLLSPRKPNALDFISIDICGLLPLLLNNNCYFIKIVDNATRKI